MILLMVFIVEMKVKLSTKNKIFTFCQRGEQEPIPRAIVHGLIDPETSICIWSKLSPQGVHKLNANEWFHVNRATFRPWVLRFRPKVRKQWSFFSKLYRRGLRSFVVFPLWRFFVIIFNFSEPYVRIDNRYRKLVNGLSKNIEMFQKLKLNFFEKSSTFKNIQHFRNILKKSTKIAANRYFYIACK